MRRLKQFIFQCLVGAIAPASAFAADSFRGNTVETFQPGADAQPLRIPSAAAIGADDSLFVLDGVHNRVVVFGQDGAIRRAITGFGDQQFSQPVGLRASPDGNLWIADSGNSRILVGTPDGALVRQIALPAAEDGRQADPTDVAWLPNGTPWIVDNDNHRLVRANPADSTLQIVGKLGPSLGQFEYPFSIVANRNGDLIVSDVINARVQLLSPDGTPLRPIGAYGVNYGQFLRPTGVALDAQERIWIADSVMGVVQVFLQDGSYVDVLRGADESPLRFEAPLGLTFDKSGALYVVESRAARVSKIAIERTARMAPPTPPVRTGAAPSGQQSKSCTLCHLDWLPDFAGGRDGNLMPRPLSGKDDPAVARAEMCLSCHDGAVADSRRRVWEDHGHRTGVSPPETMTVPGHLPLIGGKLGCRTCHSAHGSEVPQGDYRRAMLLRVPNPASELCISCHTDKTRGPRFGTHPTGGMPWPIPDKLVAAGAKVGPNPRELTCQVCHTPHGAKNDHLLVLGTSTNQLCVTCHDQMRPGMFRDGSHAEHPLTAKLNEEQVRAVHDLGTKMGPEGQLVCLSCHKLHHGHGQRFMLAEDLAEGQMCLRCHSERREMVGTSHDLRTNFPQERNRLGLSPSEGGPCSSCHLFHRFARQTIPGPGDAAGQCLSCHSPGQCAQGKALPAVNHPSLRCTECHNPHNPRNGKFLAAPPAQLCSQCHSDKALLIGGPHDALGSPDKWCLAGAPAADPCLSCHRPHGDADHGLFRVAPVEAPSASAGACLACHPGADPSASGSFALRHPQGPIPAAFTESKRPHVPNADAAAVNCASCHDPHRAPAGAAALLRATTPSGIDLCVRCHTDMTDIVRTAHSPDSLARRQLDSTACQPCHQVHGDATLVSSQRLWPQHLTGLSSAKSPAADSGLVPVGDALCTGCHRDAGPAAQPIIASHPDVKMFDLPGISADQLPLFGDCGLVDANGVMQCRTCHLPHGKAVGNVETATPAGTAKPVGEQAPGVTGSAQRLQLRTFEPPNVCTSCHGADALRRYLYFHDPQRRGGALSASR